MKLDKTAKIVITLLALGFILRLSLVLLNIQTPERLLALDSQDYRELADAVATTGSYARNGETEIFRAPGYPFFLAPLHWLFGNTPVPAACLQVLIDTATCLLVWLLARQLFQDKLISLSALILQIICVVSISYSVRVLSETTFTFLFVLTLYLLECVPARSEEQDKWTLLKASGAGLSLGLAALLRAIILPVVPLAVIYLGIRHRKWQQVLCLLLPVVLLIGGWTARNKLTANYLGFASVSDINFYRYYACALLARQNGISFAEQQRRCDQKLAECGSQLKQAQFSKREGLKSIFSSPLTYTWLHMRANMRNLLPADGELFKLFGAEIGGSGTLGVIQSKGILAGVKHYFDGNWLLFIIAIPSVIILMTKYLLIPIGAYGKFRMDKRLTIAFYLLCLAYFLLIPGPPAHPRFRVPVSPLISVFAAMGISYLVMEYTKRKQAKAGNAGTQQSVADE